MSGAQRYEVAIVGAGFGGIIAALALKDAGRDSFVILERSSEVGGVWRDNRYPGCACDVRSHLYSIETRPNPDWSSSYAPQSEILEYLKTVVRNDGLRSSIRFGALVEELRYREAEGEWELSIAGSAPLRARAVILATGPQNRPALPNIPGIERFEGLSFHSSAWGDTQRLRGKRVAVVGTGASAIQIVPNIAPLVSALHVYQRTPAWVMPRGDHAYTPLRRAAFRRIPGLQSAFRSAIYWSLEFFGLAFLGNRPIYRALEAVALRKLRHEVRDPETRRKLTPNYALGCKRVLVSDDFYPAFNRPNVHLIAEPAERVTARGIETREGFREHDAIVYATGFNVADTEGYLRVVGRGGRILASEWNSNGSQAYLGINVAGYPNLCLLLGPNSGLGHSSALHVMESQMRYVLKYLDTLRRAPGMALDVRPEIQSAYCEKVQLDLARTVWASGCKSWYINRAGRNNTLYPGLTADYRRATARFDTSHYSLERHA